MAPPVPSAEVRSHRAFALWLLFAINTVNFFDRQILGAVTEPLRRDWHLTDLQVGALGTAFTLLYAVVGIPLGRLADEWSRKKLLGLGVFAWSLLTAFSGLAWNFWSLFLMRLGVGIGEATCAPASSSLLGDLYTPSKRARAFSLFMLGLPVGQALSYIVSGTVAQHYGWRSAFLVAGLPGLLLAALTIRLQEPPRGHQEAVSVQRARRSGSPYLLILGIPTLWWIILSGAIHNFNMYAISSFLPAFLTRFHGLDVKTSGFVVGIVYGFVGGLGMLLGGVVGDRMYRWRSNGRMLLTLGAFVLALPLFALALACAPGQVWQFAAFMMPASLLMYVYYAAIYATIQDLVEPALRGTAMALYFFAMYLLGASLGPVGTGLLSDTLAHRAATLAGSPAVTEEFRAVGLHQAMYLIPLLGVLLVLVLAAGAWTAGKDIDKVRRWMQSLEKSPHLP